MGLLPKTLFCLAALLSLAARAQAVDPLYIDVNWNKAVDHDLHLVEHELFSTGAAANSMPPAITAAEGTVWELQGLQGSDGFVGHFVFENTTVTGEPKSRMTVKISAFLIDNEVRSTVTSASFNSSILVQYRSHFSASDRIALHMLIDDNFDMLQMGSTDGPREHILKIRYPDSLLGVSSPAIPSDKTFTITLPDHGANQTFLAGVPAADLEVFLSVLGQVQIYQEEFYDEATDSFVAGVQYNIFLQHPARIEVSADFTPDAEWFLMSFDDTSRNYWMTHEITFEGMNSANLPAGATFGLEVSVPGFAVCKLNGLDVFTTASTLTTNLATCPGLAAQTSFQVEVDASEDPLARKIKVMFSTDIGINVFGETESNNFGVHHMGAFADSISTLGREHEIEVKTDDSSQLPTGSSIIYFVNIPGKGERSLESLSSSASAADVASGLSTIFTDEGLVAIVDRYSLPGGSGYVFHVVFNKDVIIRTELAGTISGVNVDQFVLDDLVRESHVHGWTLQSANGGTPSASTNVEYSVSVPGVGDATFDFPSDVDAATILAELNTHYSGTVSDLALTSVTKQDGSLKFLLNSPTHPIRVKLTPLGSEVLIDHEVLQEPPQMATSDELLITLISNDNVTPVATGEYEIVMHILSGGVIHERTVSALVADLGPAIQTQMTAALSTLGVSATVGDITTSSTTEKKLIFSFSSPIDFGVKLVEGEDVTSLSFITSSPVSYHLLINSGLATLLSSGTVDMDFDWFNGSSMQQFQASISVTDAESVIKAGIDSALTSTGIDVVVTEVTTVVPGQRKLQLDFSGALAMTASLSGVGGLASLAIVQL